MAFIAPSAKTVGNVVTAANWNQDVTANTIALGGAPNELVNGGFERWQRGAGIFSASGAYTADGWKIVLGGTSSLNVEREGTNIDSGSQWAAKCTYTHGTAATVLRQTDSRYVQFRGRTIAASIRVKTSTVSAIRLRVTDGVNTFLSGFHTGGGAWETISLWRGSATASQLFIEVQFEVGTAQIHYLDSAALITGFAVLPDYFPLPVEEDIRRCQQWYEVLGPTNTGSLIVAGVATAAGNLAWAPLRFLVQKPVTPTMAKVGTWAVVNANQPLVQSPDVDGCRISVDAVAAGQFYAHNNVAGCWLTADASP